jgi:hypothetical protein
MVDEVGSPDVYHYESKPLAISLADTATIPRYKEDFPLDRSITSLITMSDPGMASELGGIGTLLRLPAEVRKKIYRYLLSTEYTNYTADPEDDASLTVLRDCTTLWPR